LRWYLGQKFVFHLPVGKQGTQTSVAQTFFLFLVAFDVESEGLVVDEAARPSELPQVAELFAMGSKFEFECLQSQPNPIVLIIKRYSSRQTLRLRIACPFGLRHKVSKESI
jgi:hypothetical protein